MTAPDESNPPSDGHPAEPKLVLTVCFVSIAGLMVHNLAEFPPGILLRPETLAPLAVTIALAWALIQHPGRASSLAAFFWALIVIVLGGGSVLPLGLWPFNPEQTVSHYIVHLVYAVAQLPLLWVAWRRFRTPPRADRV